MPKQKMLIPCLQLVKLKVTKTFRARKAPGLCEGNLRTYCFAAIAAARKARPSRVRCGSTPTMRSSNINWPR